MEFRREIFQFSGHIKKAADYGAQMATLLKEKPQLESIDSILKELGVLDKATDLDLKALDEVVAEFQKRPEIEQVDKPIMDSLFQQKRQTGTSGKGKKRAIVSNSNSEENDTMPGVGRNQDHIEMIRSTLRNRIVTNNPINSENANSNSQNETCPGPSSTRRKQSRNSDQILITKEWISDKDPISKKRIVNPIKNAICGHIYDRDYTQGYIQQCKDRKQLCQCPVRLCQNKKVLQMDQMIPFPEFFNLIEPQHDDNSED